MGQKISYRDDILDVIRGRDQYGRYVSFVVYTDDPDTNPTFSILANVGSLRDAVVAVETLRLSGHPTAQYRVTVRDSSHAGRRPDLDDLSGGIRA